MTKGSLDRTMLPPEPWTGVTGDSRRVQPGYAFVAIQGSRTDGHRFVTDALRRGAGCIYSERPLPRPFPVPTFLVSDARKTLAELTAHFHGNPAQQIRCIGATGTNGKTTTTTLLQWILNASTRRAGLMGTVHTDTGDHVEDALLTTPDAESLHKGLADMVRNGLEYAILEVSSHGLKQHRVHGVPFELGVFTNLSSDHSDFHPTVDDYVETKARLFASIPPDGAVVLNADDLYMPRMARRVIANLFTFSTLAPNTTQADVVAERVTHTKHGMYVRLRISAPLRQAARFGPLLDGSKSVSLPEQLELFVPLFGQHNLANAVGAITAAILQGVSTADIQSAVARFPGVWRRQQRLPIQGPTIIDDCCHNPGSYGALFEALRHQAARRLYFVNAIRGNRGELINQAIAAELGNWAITQPNLELWITDCYDTAGPHDIVSQHEREAFLAALDKLGVRYQYRRDLQPALEELASRLAPGDVGVLAGAHAMDTAARLFLALWAKRAVS